MLDPALRAASPVAKVLDAFAASVTSVSVLGLVLLFPFEEGAYFMPQPMMMMGAGMGAGMVGAGGYYHYHPHPQGGQVVSMGGEGQSDYYATPHAAQDGRAHDVNSNMLQHNAGQMQRLQAAQLMQQHAKGIGASRRGTDGEDFDGGRRRRGRSPTKHS